jgi:hypothetical protein
MKTSEVRTSTQAIERCLHAQLTKTNHSDLCVQLVALGRTSANASMSPRRPRALPWLPGCAVCAVRGGAALTRHPSDIDIDDT